MRVAFFFSFFFFLYPLPPFSFVPSGIFIHLKTNSLWTSSAPSISLSLPFCGHVADTHQLYLSLQVPSAQQQHTHTHTHTRATPSRLSRQTTATHPSNHIMKMPTVAAVSPWAASSAQSQVSTEDSAALSCFSSSVSCASVCDDLSSVSADAEACPCRHNRWKRVRKMKDGLRVLLRCLTCAKSWATRTELHEKCGAFYRGECTLGGDCPHPHIYSRSAVKELNGTAVPPPKPLPQPQVQPRPQEEENADASVSAKATAKAAAAAARASAESAPASSRLPLYAKLRPVACVDTSSAAASPIASPSHVQHSPMYRHNPYSVDSSLQTVVGVMHGGLFSNSYDQ